MLSFSKQLIIMWQLFMYTLFPNSKTTDTAKHSLMSVQCAIYVYIYINMYYIYIYIYTYIRIRLYIYYIYRRIRIYVYILLYIHNTCIAENLEDIAYEKHFLYFQLCVKICVSFLFRSVVCISFKIM